MLDVDDDTAVRLGQYTAQDTENGGIERIDPKRALAQMDKKLSGFFSMLMENGTEDETFAQLIDRNGDQVIKWMVNNGFISATQAKSAFDRKGNLIAEAKNDLKKLMFESVFRGGNAALAEKFARIPVKTQNAILATAWRDNNSPDGQRMNADLQESIEALYELMRDPDFAKAKDKEDILRSIRGWEAMTDFDTATGDTIQRKGKYSNFALRLAATYKAYGQKATESILNRIYDLVQGKAEATLFEEADNKPHTLAEAIKEVLNIEYDGKNRSDLLGSDTTGSEEGRGGIFGNTPSGEQATSGERRTDGGAGAAGVLGAERGVAADNAKREGASRAAEGQDARQGGTVPASEGRAAEAGAEEGNAKQDSQGNPLNADSSLKLETVSSIDDLTDEDFTNPTRNVQLPELPESVAQAIGTGGKPMVIKKSIFEKNRDEHKELTSEKSRDILQRALYNPNLVGTTRRAKRPDYRVVIQTGDKNAVVMLDVYDGKDNTEIVGWREIDAKGLEKMKRQAEREDGQLLILSPSNGSAAALSTLPLDTASEGKDSKESSTTQREQPATAEKIEDYGEEIAGARKSKTVLFNIGKRKALPKTVRLIRRRPFMYLAFQATRWQRYEKILKHSP